MAKHEVYVTKEDKNEPNSGRDYYITIFYPKLLKFVSTTPWIQIINKR